MKDLKLKGVGVMVSLLLLTACNDGSEPGRATGTIAPKLTCDPTLVAVGSSSSSADTNNSGGLESVKVSDLMLTLTSEDGEVNESFLAENFPVDKEFAVGEYTMTATYGQVEAEGFEVPSIKGESTFSITEGNTTVVNLVATPSKAMISIAFDDALTEYMTSLSATITTIAGNNIEYAADETRSAYVKPGNTVLSISFVKPNGMGGTVEVANFEAEARKHYSITVKLGGEGSGQIDAITVKFDDSLKTKDVMVDISDAVLSLPAPVVTSEGFTNGEEFTVVEGDALPNGARFNIDARSGIAKAVLTTTGRPLVAQGWPEEIDLTKASLTEQAMLEKLGFKDLGLFRNPAKMAAVDLSGVVAHIPASTTSVTPVAFSLVVTDKKGMSSEPVGFSVSVIKMQLALSVVQGYTYTGGQNITCVVSYNGDKKLKDILTIQYKNNRGNFADGKVAAVVNPSEEGSIDYNVIVSAPSDANMPLTLRAVCGNLVSNEIEIPCSGQPVLTVTDNDVYAKYVWATVSSEVLASQTPVVQISYDKGKTFVEATSTYQNGNVKYTNLTPATSYQLRVQMGALVSEAVSVTTEEATQIPSSDMEEWDSSEVITRLSGGYKWTNYKPGSPWATINSASLASASGNGLCTANETTMYTTDAHGGERAAEVRSGACSATTLTSASNWTYFRGELYVGYYSDGPNYGTYFGSRPSALKFWYKYMPYNDTADQGYAMIQILDVDGNIISSSETTLNPTDEYLQATVKLSYKRSSAKANKIIVLFRSSATTDFMNSTGFPSIGGSLNKKLTGSKLYVDDIELSY